jgi:hypothetical protein
MLPGTHFGQHTTAARFLPKRLSNTFNFNKKKGNLLPAQFLCLPISVPSIPTPFTYWPTLGYLSGLRSYEAWAPSKAVSSQTTPSTLLQRLQRGELATANLGCCYNCQFAEASGSLVQNIRYHISRMDDALPLKIAHICETRTHALPSTVLAPQEHHWAAKR